MSKATKVQQLEARIAENQRGEACTIGKQLLAEYLDKENPTSYRKLAKKHDLAVKTVARHIRAAAEES